LFNENVPTFGGNSDIRCMVWYPGPFDARWPDILHDFTVLVHGAHQMNLPDGYRD
jgi:hypothetical protein